MATENKDALSKEEQEFLDWLKNTDDETLQKEIDAAYSEVCDVVGYVNEIVKTVKSAKE